jgi:hypothetical protein
MSATINGRQITQTLTDWAVGFLDDEEVVDCGDEDDADELLQVVNVILDGNAKKLARYVYMTDYEEVE